MFVGCKREPPDITEAQAEAIAHKEQPNWCNAEGFKCSDFRSIGKQPPPEPGWEWSWQWAADHAAQPVILAVVVNKKGDVAARIMAMPAAGVPALTGVASAGKPPAAAATPATSTSTVAGKPVAVSTAAPTLAKAPATAPPAPGAPALDPNDPKPRTPPPLDAVGVTPPPLSSSKSEAEFLETMEPTWEEVFRACETEIGILCLRSPSSVPQARNCLRPHRAALRAACGKTVGLKRSAFDED